jgi:peptidyl-prolyl cis-trans isomerase SurA
VLARRGIIRVLLAGVAATLAVTGLAGCRTSPTVAAYVGNTQVSVAELDSGVAARQSADKAVAAFAQTDRAAFARQVLGLLVTQDVYAEVSRRYGVQVSDDTVRQRITQLLTGSDPTQAYGQLAAKGIGRTDVFENVRQQLVRQELAAEKGLTGPLSESALRARYEQVKNDLAQREFGFITVPDQATGSSVLAALTADPGQYPTVAARYPGQYTIPALQPRTSAEIPTAFTSAVAAAAPNSGFVETVPQVGTVVVFVGKTVIPTFEEARAQLEQEASSTVDAAAQKLVDSVRSDLRVTVNPRYGVLKNGTVSEATGGPVNILGSAAASASATSGTTGTPGG